MDIGIVGLGLIGGSLGLDFRACEHTVYGMSRSPETCRIAEQIGAVNQASPTPEILSQVDVVFLCTPIGLLGQVCAQIKPHLRTDTIVTDVGSVKVDVIDAIAPQWPLFIGGHPMAGTADSGIRAAQSHLFRNRPYVLTPSPQTPESLTNTLSQLIRDLEANLFLATPTQHDRAVALISHLPILISANLIKTCMDPNNQEALSLAQSLASSGFCDTSRVGGGNPELGRMVAQFNRDELLRSLDLYEANLKALRTLVEEHSWESLEAELAQTQQQRPKFL